ncbi:conserved hypothetical protein [Ktedonobacter racemifer DSM 44963]|uniref:Uncharacterized protein n=1 Tax=Ktedonobacter racemifer DSM 44963 TaxID=485913 RepID=D6U1I2_KTERA|nr:conserved hypothetical protein [Ktedonobacter racemifer DSM 44963]
MRGYFLSASIRATSTRARCTSRTMKYVAVAQATDATTDARGTVSASSSPTLCLC